MEFFLVALLSSSKLERVMHPEVDCWKGERSWSAPGEPQSDFVSFDTKNDPSPFKITHNRETFFEGGQLQQDYNYIDYYFGSKKNPVTARHYLRSGEVSITPPKGARELASAQQAADEISSYVLCYLKKRHSVGTILTVSGYERLWGDAKHDRD